MMSESRGPSDSHGIKAVSSSSPVAVQQYPTTPKHEEITQSLPIPEYKMGWIIGKRGTYINQLAKKSGANIVVSDSTSREYVSVHAFFNDH